MKNTQEKMTKEKLTKEELVPTEIITCQGERIIANNVIFLATDVISIDGVPAEEGQAVQQLVGGWGLRELASARSRMERVFMECGQGIIEQIVEEHGPMEAMMYLMQMADEIKMENMMRHMENSDMGDILKKFEQLLKK